MERASQNAPTRFLPCLLVVAAMGLVVWVRLVPLGLGGTPPAERPLLTYTADDGREHVYLAGYDSYFWLRAARNQLGTGSPCDALVNGECRDTHTLAPVGGHMGYPRSAHVLAIAAVHRIATFFRPGWPLPSSAYLVPVLVGMLAVLPAFAIGRRLAGDVGGLFAALLIGLNPIFLLRSATSDNDVWNVFLPLCLFWAVLGAMTPSSSWRRAAYILAAVLFAGLHALTWRGWIFSAAVALFGLLAHLAVLAVRFTTKRIGAWRAIVFLGCFSGGFFLLARAAGVPLFAELARLQEGLSLFGSAAGSAAYWPDPFVTVGELARPDLRTIAGLTGGLVYFFVAWLGLLLLFLPRRGWQWWHFAVLIAGNYLYSHLLQHGSPGRLALLTLLMLPLATALVLYSVEDEPPASGGPAGMLVVVWLLASLFLAFDGNRYLILLLPPFAVAFGVAVGRVHGWLADLAEGRRLPRRVVRPALLALVGLLLVPPIRAARATADALRPRVNDAWWDTLTRIRDETPPDAIISTWWPYGYWVAYGAARRVSADGGSLPSRVPYWLARALLSPSERETIGLLRMLDCGSDASTWPEREAGAYHPLTQAGLDDLAAETLVVGLAVRSRSEARALLAAQKLSEQKRAGILDATHCRPPPAYVVLSSELVTVPGWKLLGNWSLQRAYVASVLGDRPEDEAVADIVDRFRMAEDEARALRGRAARLASPEALRDFVSPPLAFLSDDWLACRVEGVENVCPIPALGTPERGAPVFAYRDDAPLAGRLRSERGGRTAWREAPAEILVAGPERIESAVFEAPRQPPLGVLVDVRNRRILAGSPELLRSTFTQLLFLDGGYMRQFEKFDERTGYGGERVVTWRVRWEDPRAGAAASGSAAATMR